MISKLPLKAVDLFCGAGGLTHGLLKSGIDVVAGFDIEESCRFPYEFNNNSKFITKDVTVLRADEVRHYLKGGKYTLLAGCAPCQPFSTYSRQRKQTDDTDHRWNLLTSFGLIVSDILPDFVTIENVPGLAEQQVFRDFLKLLNNLDYRVDFEIIYCPDFGMAQTRKRLVLIASRLGTIELPKSTHSENNYVTVRDVLSHLPEIKAGETCKVDPLHKASILTPLNLKRIQASLPGGSWADWPEELRAECHRRVSGKTYPSVYGRMSWDSPAPTITTQCNGYGNGRFGHPEQDRAISLREAAILQSFPEEYQFFPVGEKRSISSVAKMIGNAVPVSLGQLVGQSIRNALTNI